MMSDFSDLKALEMTKVRPVIVVSPKLPHRSEIVAIVPVSLTAPRHSLPYCYKLSKNYHPAEAEDLDCWAKADMVMNINIGRLSAFRIGRRKYAYPALTAGDLLGVRKAVMAGLGLDRLIQPEV